MKQQLTLGDLIDRLKALPRDHRIFYDFCGLVPDGLASWRGIYAQLALGWNENAEPTVGDVLDLCEGVVGTVRQGYKGGDYRMDRGTPVWAANWGQVGSTAVLDVADRGYWAIIETGYRDV